MDHDCLRTLYYRAPLCIYTIGADGRLVAMNSTRLGMILERAADVLGRAHIRSTLGCGTQERISVPLSRENEQCP